MLAITHLGPNRTSIFMNLMPVFTAVIAYVWLKEAWTVYHTVGGVVIICGILLAQRKTALKNGTFSKLDGLILVKNDHLNYFFNRIIH